MLTVIYTGENCCHQERRIGVNGCSTKLLLLDMEDRELDTPRDLIVPDVAL